MPRFDIGNDVVSAWPMVTSTAETAILSPGGAGIYRDLRHLSITNRSTSTHVLVVLSCSSGSNSTGYRWTLAERGGIVLDFEPLMNQTTANASWCLTISPSATVDVVVRAIDRTT